MDGRLARLRSPGCHRSHILGAGAGRGTCDVFYRHLNILTELSQLPPLGPLHRRLVMQTTARVSFAKQAKRIKRDKVSRVLMCAGVCLPLL
jgi:hypothetical protein